MVIFLYNEPNEDYELFEAGWLSLHAGRSCLRRMVETSFPIIGVLRGIGLEGASYPRERHAEPVEAWGPGRGIHPSTGSILRSTT